MNKTNWTRRPLDSNGFAALTLLGSMIALLVGCTPKAQQPPAVTTKTTPVAEATEEVATSEPREPVAEPREQTEWTSLFDGESLTNWKSTQFGAEGDVTVEDGTIVLGLGNDMTGVTWKGEPPARMNYEIELEAMRVEGSDFFCGLTFPVGDAPCSLIVGGWGGGMTGLSSLDGNDASQNETSKWINYENGRWYRIRLRVTESKIESWLDDAEIISADTTGRKIGIRSEVDASRPLGIATWRTTGALRKIRIRRL